MDRRTAFAAYGVECDEGWKKLYQPLIDLCRLYHTEVLQVKEKFGGLRFYIGGSPNPDHANWLDAMISAAEAASYHTCEHCGEDGIERHDPETRRPVYKATTGGQGWIKTFCAPCREKWEERRRGGK